MLTLQESLFDKNLVDKKLIDWDKFKRTFVEKKPIDRFNLFKGLYWILTDSRAEDSFEIIWTDEQIEEYKNQHLAFEYIIESLKEAFKKQGGISWLCVNEHDFETLGDVMDEDEIDYQNDELQYFCYCLSKRTAHESHFVVGEGKIPDSIMFILDKVIKGRVSSAVWRIIKNPSDWAIEYFDRMFGSQKLYTFICPKNLDPFVKKLLYK